MVCGVLYGMSAIVWYGDCCMVCGVLFGMGAVV